VDGEDGRYAIRHDLREEQSERLHV
jgi:hypothetical protein